MCEEWGTNVWECLASSHKVIFPSNLWLIKKTSWGYRIVQTQIQLLHLGSSVSQNGVLMLTVQSVQFSIGYFNFLHRWGCLLSFRTPGENRVFALCYFLILKIFHQPVIIFPIFSCLIYLSNSKTVMLWYLFHSNPTLSTF